MLEVIASETGAAMQEAIDLGQIATAGHVLRPQHLRSTINIFDPLSVVTADLPHLPARLDIDGFAARLAAALDDNVAGYSMQLRRGGATALAKSRGWAKFPGDPSFFANPTGLPWDASVRMHVASCSKLVTAVAMTKLLRTKALDPKTTTIGNLLPAHWEKGPKVADVTIDDLLTHRSGFNTKGPGPGDYPFMKEKVAEGAPKHGSGIVAYANINYALCRIILPILNGDIAPNATFDLRGLPPGVLDEAWDYLTIQAFKAYVQANVFWPAGLGVPSLKHGDSNALAYPFPVTEAGWNSGDLSTWAGAGGWHLSVDDLLTLMGALRRGMSGILSPADTQAMLDAGYGVDEKVSTGLIALYGKGGWFMHEAQVPGKKAWLPPQTVDWVEQACLFFLPEDMEVAVLVNSPTGGADPSIYTLVKNLLIINFKA